MFLTNQIAQLRVLDFTYTTSVPFPAVENLREHLYYPPRTLILPENCLLLYLGKKIVSRT